MLPEIEVQCVLQCELGFRVSANGGKEFAFVIASHVGRGGAGQFFAL